MCDQINYVQTKISSPRDWESKKSVYMVTGNKTIIFSNYFQLINTIKIWMESWSLSKFCILSCTCECKGLPGWQPIFLLMWHALMYNMDWFNAIMNSMYCRLINWISLDSMHAWNQHYKYEARMRKFCSTVYCAGIIVEFEQVTFVGFSAIHILTGTVCEVVVNVYNHCTLLTIFRRDF